MRISKPMNANPEALLGYSNTLYIVGAIITLFGTFGIVYFSGAASKIKEAQLKQYQKNADVRIAEANAKGATAIEEAAAANAAAALARAASEKLKTDSEGLRKDVAVANAAAAKAQSEVATATEQAARANLELARIRAPRSLNDLSHLSVELKKFKGVEYSFETVYQDPEPIELVKTIDSLLQLAEWTKVKPESQAFPALNIYGKEDGFAVGIGFATGVALSAGSQDPDGATVLPLESLPRHVQAAVALRAALISGLSPTATDADVAKVNLKKGARSVVSISVGRKP
jgi:hypothetical protein